MEHAYLERIEPLEARIAQGRVARIERLIHLRLRPGLARGADTAEVARDIAALRGELLAADAVLRAGTPFWFGAANAFVILVREGLEAVLLIGALLAYLSAAGAGRRERRQIFVGVGAGMLATLATWVLARTFVPLGGASRELVEGVTGLLAVGVLLYVSHWLFQKTYIQDWKEYLRQHVGRAVTSGSAMAMASLAFAAVYREGFETVLFYQAIVFDAGTGSVLAGCVPGLVLIVGLGVAIIRMGVRLPLRRVFGVTNAILLYLAVVFLGKGIYNLQEAGLFAPHPLGWVPDHGALRQLFGLYPIAESLAAQLVLLTALSAVSIYFRRRLARQRAAAAAPPRLATSR
ncbi:MAG TPA: FTR1 family protein [Longimicrobiales bacterium]|nr:FTR1 family protein [Longimicrobiales bacterium]